MSTYRGNFRDLRIEWAQHDTVSGTVTHPAPHGFEAAASRLVARGLATRVVGGFRLTATAMTAAEEILVRFLGGDHG